MISVLDFEGTSRLASARATEIGIVRLKSDFSVAHEFESLVHSPVRADSFALKVSKLSNSEINSAPSFHELWPHIHEFVSGSVMVAHNKIYEMNVLRNELQELSLYELPPFICTLEWSRKILNSKISNFQLKTVCDYLGVKLDNGHEALSDARATAEVFNILASKSKGLRDEIDVQRQRILSYQVPKKNSIKPLVRERIIIDDHNGVQFTDALKRVESRGLQTVVITGVPVLGKEGLGHELAKVGLVYKETAPGLKTAFVVKSDKDPGLSKIKKARELNIPILSESGTLDLISKLQGA